MSYKSIIPAKCAYYFDYINNNGLTDKLIEPSKKSTYSIESYLSIYFYFQMSGLSYNRFYELMKYATSIGPNGYPKKTALHEFKSKLSKLKIHENIHSSHIDNIITDDCLMDSVTVPNKCNSKLVGDYNYKGKKGVKITHITNDVGYPICASVDAGSDNDAKAGLKIIENNLAILEANNVTLLSDKGYDSNNIREFVYANGFSVIIPKNIRRTDNAKIRDIKNAEREKITIKRKQLMINQKELNKQKQLKVAERKRINRHKSNNIKKITLAKLDKIIREVTKQVDDTKTERKKLPTQLKANIKDKINELVIKDKQQKCAESKGFRLCAFCDHNKVCNECEICKKCKKNLSYYNGLSNSEIIRYKKRIRVEHFISHYKNGRTTNIKDRRRNMLNDTIYNRYTDFLFIKNIIK